LWRSHSRLLTMENEIETHPVAVTFVDGSAQDFSFVAGVKAAGEQVILVNGNGNPIAFLSMRNVKAIYLPVNELPPQPPDPASKLLVPAGVRL
jgi:hypothetical protein